MSNARIGNPFYQGPAIRMSHHTITGVGTTAEVINSPFTVVLQVLISNGGASGAANSVPTWTAVAGVVTTGTISSGATYVATVIGF